MQYVNCGWHYMWCHMVDTSCNGIMSSHVNVFLNNEIYTLIFDTYIQGFCRFQQIFSFLSPFFRWLWLKFKPSLTPFPKNIYRKNVLDLPAKSINSQVKVGMIHWKKVWLVHNCSSEKQGLFTQDWGICAAVVPPLNVLQYFTTVLRQDTLRRL